MKRYALVFALAALCAALGAAHSLPAYGGTEPRLAGVEGVTNPKIIDKSKVSPEYPEKAKEEKIEGKVILQAVVTREGTVRDVKVLRCSKPDHGFEKSAVEAVKRWRYEPSTLDGDPVDVYITVVVDFILDKSERRLGDGDEPIAL